MKRLAAVIVVGALVLPGCAQLGVVGGPGAEGAAARDTRAADEGATPVGKEESSVDSPGTDAGPEPEGEVGRQADVFPGTGRFVKPFDPEDKPWHGVEKEGGERFSLDFEGATIEEVVKTILGDILRVSYSIEPGLQGKVSLHTMNPVPESDLFAVLESLLATRGGVIVESSEGIYRVGPRNALKAVGGAPRMGGELPVGYSLRIVPLEYIGAGEMKSILQPIAPQDAFVRVDKERNLLILAGTAPQLRNMLDTVETFDVNKLEGMSVGIYPLDNVAAEDLQGNLDQILASESAEGVGDLVRLVPLEQLNSLMVMTPRKAYLGIIETWIERLDRAGASARPRLYVYAVENGEASHLGDMVGQVLLVEASGGGARQARGGDTAPGMQPVSATSKGDDGSSDAGTPETAPKRTAGGAVNTALGGDGLPVDGLEDVRIVADDENNALLIFATEEQYEVIRQALEKLDIEPMQVLVEATIMEVTLEGELQYGLQWFFKNSVDDYSGQGTLDLDDSAGLSGSIPGFSYTLTDASGVVRGVLNALAKDSRLRVISSPSLLVLDNHTAQIRVGDQQPVSVGETITDGGVSTSSIQYKDTGVMLEVTPRVNKGGLVTMEINQEVTDVGSVDQATGQRSFLQRQVKSTIAVDSGKTVVLGGLIRDNSSRGKNGVPGLYRLPVVGNLFGGTTRTSTRTELLVLMTPRAITSQEELLDAGEELRSKMQGLFEEFEDDRASARDAARGGGD